MIRMKQPARRLTLFAFATAALFAAMLLVAPFPILDTQPGLTADSVYRSLGQLSASQLSRYRVMLALDVLFPLAYAGFLVTACQAIAKRKPRLGVLCRIGGAAAIAAALIDYVENSFIIIILQAFPEPVFAAGLVGFVTSVKWSVVGVAVLVCVVALVLPVSDRVG